MDKRLKDKLVYPAILCSMIFWSISYVWTKLVYNFLSPLSTIFFRQVAGSIFLVLFTLLVKKLNKIKREDIKTFIILSFFHPLIYFTCESIGIKLVSPTLAAVIISTIPLLMPFASAIFLKEKINMTNVTGLVISFTGILVIILDKNLSLSASPAGIVMLMLAVLSGIAYTIMLRPVGLKYNTMTIVSVQNLLGTLWFAVIFFIFEFREVSAMFRFISTLKSLNRELIELISINRAVTGSLITVSDVSLPDSLFMPLIQLSLFSTGLAFIFFTFSVKKIGASRTSAFTNCIPVFTMIFAWLYLNDPITGKNLTGITIVITGLFLSQIKSSERRVKKH